MSIEVLEVSWRVGADRFSFTLTPDGTPHLTGPGVRELPEGAEPTPRPGRAAPARRGKVWSDEEEAQLREWFTRGDSPADIGAVLDRTSGAVRARLVRMGLLDEEAAGLRYPVPRAVPDEPASTREQG
ncbi:MAG: hypothetical protein Q8P18_29990 [Pseudomonadota bacterium]|nr:hypothetical protein [Pseudomonadota bacterium]